MIKRILGIVAGLMLGLAPGAACHAAPPKAGELAAAQKAQERGLQMYLYDQAAWHATDRFQADLRGIGKSPADPALRLSGYIVEPTSGDALLVSFYGGEGAAAVARARYTVDSAGHIEGGIVADGGDSAMSPLALRMIAAREIAWHRASRPGHELCSASQANALVLPPGPDGSVAVYVLTSSADAEVYPAGGHYRFDVAQDGKLMAERRFMATCFPVEVGKMRREKAEVMFLTHHLDRQPTEIHSFVSLNIGFPLVIATTDNKLLWGVVDGRITYLRELEKK
ncbi:hypothetical protein [Novosphingobium resinovorum]|uniref:hypothetical protein n=1 Tax=Novosphingobium resinovorum TaxID=158500 RepID=UPI002329A3DC|nr:hypothetical protein GCM10017612_14110 [Novosphingobium resinovorum]